MADKFFWADQLAENIIKSKGKKKEYVCASGITPSGTVHIGNFREVITTDMVVRALRDKGKKVRFIYSWDDYDRFRKVPKNVDKGFEKYLGMPVSEVPSPAKGDKSYASHFEKIFEKSLKNVGIKPEFIYQNERNKRRKYAELIKIAVDNRDKIKKILNKYRQEPLKNDWYPLTVYCGECYKDFTKIISVEGYVIEYECKCGKKGKFDFRKKGLVKLPWRVDWSARWKYEKIDFEPGGADHSAAGGSFDTGKQIVKEVFDFEPPMYQIYEWVTVKGIPLSEFHSSKGNVMTVDEVLEIYEPEVLRYLFCGTRPKASFQISFDLDVIKIYEDFDNLEKRYFERKTNEKESRMYEMSMLDIPKKKPDRIGFRHLVTLVQVGKVKELNEYGKKRAKKVENWLEKYAPEEMAFEVQDKVKVKLTSKDKEAMLELKKSLETGDFTEEELFNEFYEICEKVGIKNTQFFRDAYLILINKEKGPRLASLILEIGKEKVLNLLNQL